MAETPALQRVIRLDSMQMSQTFFTDEGYLIDRPVLTSVGIFEYKNPDGSTRRELRLPEEVFDPESLASYKGKPVCITHDAGLLTKDNVMQNMIGTILSEGYRSGDDVRAEITIHDTDAMKRCRFRELSLGYNLTLEETPGEWNGEPYDAIQRDIRVNHLALVREARAGDQARLNVDSRDKQTILEGGKVMSKNPTNKAVRNDGVLTPDELKQAIEEYKANRAAEAQKQDAEENKAVAPTAEPAAPEAVTPPEKQDGEESTEPTAAEKVEEIKNSDADDGAKLQKLYDLIDALLAQIDMSVEPAAAQDSAEDTIPSTTEEENKDGEGCETKNEDDMDDPVPEVDKGFVKEGELMNADSVDYIVRRRVEVCKTGAKVNLDGLEDMSLMEARKAVIKAVKPGVRLDGKSDAYVNACYDIAKQEIEERENKNTGYQKRQMFNKQTAAVHEDSADGEDSSTKARERMIARAHNKKEEK